MAISITQYPTSPNMANNTLLFAVTSSQITQSQFQYIANLSYSGSATVLQTIKQQPNPSGYGVFDMGQIIANYLDSDNNFKTAQFATSSEASKRFQVRFGEEYATSISGAAITYTGYGPSGNPAVTASEYYYIVNGLVDPYDKVDWNFPSASYYTAVIASDGGTTYSLQNTLSNAPLTKSIQDGEYETISLFNGNFPGVSTASAYAQDIFEVQFKVYNSSNTLVQSASFFNTVQNGGGPRVNPASGSLWASVFSSQSAAQQLLTIGVGPQNIDDWTTALTSSWAYYDVIVYGQSDDGLLNDSGSFAKRRYVKEGAQCGYDGVRFAWKNEFGVWDYFTFTLQNDKTTAIERESYTQTFVDYSTPNPTVSYNKERRGIKQFYNKLTQTQTANSNWLDQDTADWLRELFYSTNVFQQIDGDFFPVAITSVELVEKTNPRAQKTFQYVIEFQPANQLNPRL
jgi:hypothetical protein